MSLIFLYTLEKSRLQRKKLHWALAQKDVHKLKQLNCSEWSLTWLVKQSWQVCFPAFLYLWIVQSSIQNLYKKRKRRQSDAVSNLRAITSDAFSNRFSVSWNQVCFGLRYSLQFWGPKATWLVITPSFHLFFLIFEDLPQLHHKHQCSLLIISY